MTRCFGGDVGPQQVLFWGGRIHLSVINDLAVVLCRGAECFFLSGTPRFGFCCQTALLPVSEGLGLSLEKLKPLESL